MAFNGIKKARKPCPIGAMRRRSDGDAPASRPGRDHPRGSVLVFTLVIMLLLALMGAAIMLNTRTEMSVAGNTTLGRAAFNRADMGAGVATLIARVLLSPTLGSVEQLLQDQGGDSVAGRVLTVDNIRSKELDFDPARLIRQARGREPAGPGGPWDYHEFQSRYAQMGLDAGDIDKADLGPHFSLTLRQGGQVAGTAVVTVDPGSGVQTGMTLGGSHYGGGDGDSLRLLLVVSVNGRAPSENSAQNAYSGESPADAPHSVLTTMFLETVR